MSLSATFPVKPSVTTTSAAPCRICVPSTLPAKSMSEEPFARSASATCASRTSGVPRVSSSPLESSPTRGRSMPCTTRANAAPMNANWTRCSGRTSALAPTSSSVTGSPGHREREGEGRREMPGSRRMWKSPAASAVPVEPAATSASASPAATARAARWTIEESGSWRVAATAVGGLRDRDAAHRRSRRPLRAGRAGRRGRTAGRGRPGRPRARPRQRPRRGRDRRRWRRRRP